MMYPQSCNRRHEPFDNRGSNTKNCATAVVGPTLRTVRRLRIDPGLYANGRKIADFNCADKLTVNEGNAGNLLNAVILGSYRLE